MAVCCAEDIKKRANKGQLGRGRDGGSAGHPSTVPQSPPFALELVVCGWKPIPDALSFKHMFHSIAPILYSLVHTVSRNSTRFALPSRSCPRPRTELEQSHTVNDSSNLDVVQLPESPMGEGPRRSRMSKRSLRPLGRLTG